MAFGRRRHACGRWTNQPGNLWQQMRKLDASFSFRQEFAQNFRGNALSYPVKYLDEWSEWQMR
jgi:hypothetical protein